MITNKYNNNHNNLNNNNLNNNNNNKYNKYNKNNLTITKIKRYIQTQKRILAENYVKSLNNKIK